MDARPKRYVKNNWITWIRKRIGDSFLCLLSLLFKESRVAERAKYTATIINKASMSVDEPTTPKRYSINHYSKKPSLIH